MERDECIESAILMFRNFVGLEVIEDALSPRVGGPKSMGPKLSMVMKSKARLLIPSIRGAGRGKFEGFVTTGADDVR